MSVIQHVYPLFSPHYVIQITFNTYTQLVGDAGQYSAHIFTLDRKQDEEAKASVQSLIERGDSKKANIPKIKYMEDDDTFHVAESYHQNYLDKNQYVPIVLGSALIINLLPRNIGVPIEMYQASAASTIMYIVYTLGQRYIYGNSVGKIKVRSPLRQS